MQYITFSIYPNQTIDQKIPFKAFSILNFVMKNQNHKYSKLIAAWMTIVTRRTGVTIIFNSAVLFVNRGFVTVLMANDTTEIRIIACRMTIGTKCPFTFVFPGINREELPIVIKGGRGPGCR